jgi:regulator of replication initiation timing
MRDYDNVVYKREYPSQPLHEILHKIFAKLENLQEEVGSLREEVKEIRLELDEYRRFIKAKGLEEELSKIFDNPVEQPQPEESKDENEDIVNRYPDWDV